MTMNTENLLHNYRKTEFLTGFLTEFLKFQIAFYKPQVAENSHNNFLSSIII